MLNQAQSVYLKTASMAYNNGEENATFNSETLLLENHWNRNLSERAMLPGFLDQTWTTLEISFLKNIGIEICPKESCFLVLITEP